jgi:hypothetical protein
LITTGKERSSGPEPRPAGEKVDRRSDRAPSDRRSFFHESPLDTTPTLEDSGSQPGLNRKRWKMSQLHRNARAVHYCDCGWTFWVVNRHMSKVTNFFNVVSHREG